MFDHLSMPLLILVFMGAAAIVWIAGIHLSKTTNILSSDWGLGEALGGLILLAIVTNLPEIVITISGVLGRKLSIVTGNILGGIAMAIQIFTSLLWACCSQPFMPRV